MFKKPLGYSCFWMMLEYIILQALPTEAVVGYKDIHAGVLVERGGANFRFLSGNVPTQQQRKGFPPQLFRGTSMFECRL